MSGLPIWGFDVPAVEVRAAKDSGWSRSEIAWERVQEVANSRVVSGSIIRPAVMFLLAYLLGELAMGRQDRRRITALANLAYTFRRFGAEQIARNLYRKADRRWRSLPLSLDHIEISPRARSSLFHMRMEAVHRETYRANRVRRLENFVAESAECLGSLCAGNQLPHRLYSRWMGEKPPVFDDSRRILAACLLIAGESTGGTAS